MRIKSHKDSLEIFALLRKRCVTFSWNVVFKHLKKHKSQSRWECNHFS